MSVKFSDVTDFMEFIVHLGGIYDVDGEGYVINKNDEADPALIKIKNKYKSLMVIQEKIKDNDACIINPLNENLREAPDARWVYTNLSFGLTRRILEIFKFIKLAVDSPDIEWPTEVIEFVSKYAKRIDQHTLDHLYIIAKDRTEFLNVFYQRKFKRAKFRCKIFEEGIREEYPKVTKKSIGIITDVMTEILGLESKTGDYAKACSEEFESSSELLTTPKMDAILKTYYKIYSKLNKYLDMTEMEDPDFVVDMTSFGIHLSNIDKYYDKVKWFSGAVDTTDSSVTKPKEESRIPVSGVPLNNIPINPVDTSSKIPLGTCGGGMGYTNAPPRPMMNPGMASVLGIQQPMYNQFQQPINNFNQPSGIPIGNSMSNIPIGNNIW